MLFHTLSFPWQIAIFLVAATLIWIAGIRLSSTTDTIAEKFGWGEALGGLILLAIVTNLPEIAIVVMASIHNDFELATGNLLGGIAVQMLVIVALDVIGLGNKDTLTSRATSLVLVLEAALVLAVLSLVIMGHEMPASISILRITPAAFLIFICWVVGIKVISKTRKQLPDISQDKTRPGKQPKPEDKSIGKAIFIFIVGSAVTLVAGATLEATSNAIAKQFHMEGLVFGATVLATITALPEISTGLAAVRMKDYEMAVSDILGGNAFLPVLFLLASVLSAKGTSALPSAKKADIYLAGLAMLMTAIYLAGLIIQPKKQYLLMGIDSIVMLVVYILGLLGLVYLG